MVKHTQTIRWLLETNCVSVFDHSWGLAQRLESYYLVLVLENSEHELSSTLLLHCNTRLRKSYYLDF